MLEHFGAKGFDYIGHSQSDLPTWQHARQIVAVAPGRGLWETLAAHGNGAEKIGNNWQYRNLLTEMRPYQWVKNSLLLLPLLAAHDISPTRVFPVLIAIIAFSFGASAIYILNDLLDLSRSAAC